ncbi:phosphoribosylglycinamide formyltransferase [Paenibacillus sp. YYML68]|uniref:phosphoribosylglycinamide formyltransferase n=1 Tax=Paenibacillus sp. YYML68 TaxID=2909250 RepID=UPI002491DE4C|nr:phosphoribosylglycinamide formyltransferase [Paenibacillus sp. YYML68]
MNDRSPFRIAVFASGSGSNFQALVDAVKEGRLDARIELLVCDKPEAKVVERAHAAGVAVHAFRPKDYASREAYEAEIVELLNAKQIDLVVMAGYMRLITSVLVEPYYGRLINVHPSLLPAFPGINAVKQALDYGVKVTGVTVHYVDGGMDTGPIIAQQSLALVPGDTEETVAERVHRIEHELYPKVVGWIRDGKVRLNGRQVELSEAAL